MKVKEYGDRNKETIILLHGGGLSWWNYREVTEKLQNKYHIILPILDGHSDSDRSFSSIEDNAQEIIDYINNNYGGHIHFIGGLSLGAQILLEILSRKKDICSYAIIESALVIPMNTTHKLIKPTFSMSYGLISKKWFSKLQFNSLRIKKELFDEYYRDTCKIGKEDMIAFMEANSKYEIKSSLQDTDAKVVVVVGDKERAIMKKSAQKIHQTISGSEFLTLPNYYHGDFSINHPQEYVDMLDKIVGDKNKPLNDKITIDTEKNFENNRFPIKDKMNKSEKTSDER